MELFLISNIVITLVAVLYNRYSKVSISAKLTLSTFALACWVVPFTLIRDYLPQEVAMNVHWLMPLHSISSSVMTTQVQVSWLSQITLADSLIFSSLLGLVFWFFRLYQHQQWVNNLKKD